MPTITLPEVTDLEWSEGHSSPGFPTIHKVVAEFADASAISFLWESDETQVDRLIAEGLLRLVDGTAEASEERFLAGLLAVRQRGEDG